MKNRVEVSLNNEPEYDFEYFDYPASVDDDAFEFFSDYGSEFADDLAIDVIEGEYPGNDYKDAKLWIDIEEANRICLAKEIPIRFVKSPGDN